MNWLKENWGSLLFWSIMLGVILYAIPDRDTKIETKSEYLDLNKYENSGEVENSYSGYDVGYYWAEQNDISDFDDCQYEFGTSSEEDGCNDYVKDNYSGYQTFNGYDCTEDCSGHEAGYEWASENGIEDTYDCDGYSNSFIEGCISYVEENY